MQAWSMTAARRFGDPFRIFTGFLLLFPAVSLAGETREAAAVFAKWRTGQRVFAEVDLEKYRTLDDDFLRHFRRLFPDSLRGQAAFLKIPAGFGSLSPGDAKGLRERLAPLVAELNDPEGLLTHLKKSGFSTLAVNKSEISTPFQKVSAKYREFFEALLWDPEEDPQRQALFTLANNFFEYCFFPAHHNDCQAMTGSPAENPLLRMIYANMWYHLSGVGWQHWNEGALQTLTDRDRAGDEIVYIAGGTDIYRLLCRGIRRIRVIDPIFPSQTKYYAEGWRFLVEASGSGMDRIRFNAAADGVDLVLLREEQVVTGKFATPELSDESKLELPQSRTVWGVFDATGKRAGEVVYERRFVRQDDFAEKKGRTFLISFNELNYVATTDEDGWGLQPSRFPSSFQMVVKQLRKPVSRAVLVNLEEMRNSSFSFIKLGTSIN